MTAFTKFLITLFIVSVTVSELSCKKSSDSEPPVISLSFSDKALEYVKLTEGKYFIYKNSVNAILDSVVVTESFLNSILTPKTPGSMIIIPAYYHERFRLKLSKFNGTTSTEWLYGIADIPFSYFSSDTAALQLQEADNSSLFYLSHSDQPALNIVVEGRSYLNVLLAVWENGLDISNQLYKKTLTYWAKGTGIIKREIISTGGTNITYSLIRNN